MQQTIGGVMDDGGTEAMLAARIGLSARHLFHSHRVAARGIKPNQALAL